MNGVFFLLLPPLVHSTDRLSESGKSWKKILPSAKAGRICALLLNYPARPDQLRSEAFFLPPCIYLFFLMSPQTALRKAVEVSLPCRCEAQMWHCLAWPGSGEQRWLWQVGHWGLGHMRAQVHIRHHPLPSCCQADAANPK